jgi:hypothetical protein
VDIHGVPLAGATRDITVYDATGGTNSRANFPSFIAYIVPGSVYTQDFNSLPDPGSISVNTANPVTIDGIIYSLPNPYGFAFPAASTGQAGGLGLPALAGWYGLADPTASVGTRFGATDGDLTTGGQISFGLPNSNNRALGLLATSSTGYTAFGAKFINGTTQALNSINLQFRSEIWRQSDKAKMLQCYYFIDPGGTNNFSTNATAELPALYVTFPTVVADVGGVAVDGTAPANQITLGVFDQPIADWQPGAALWLVWEMADATGKAQGLAIDDLNFSASAAVQTNSATPPTLSATLINPNQVILSWRTLKGQTYQLDYSGELDTSNWVAVGNPLTGGGAFLLVTNDISLSGQGFYRLRLLP